MKKIIEHWSDKECLKFCFKEAILFDTFSYKCCIFRGEGDYKVSYDNLKDFYDYFTSLIKSFVESGVKYHLLDKPSLDVYLIEDRDNYIVKCNIGENSLYMIDILEHGYFKFAGTNNISEKLWCSDNLLKKFFCNVIDEIVDGFTEEEIETKLKNLHY